MNFKTTIFLLALLIGVGISLTVIHYRGGEQNTDVPGDMTGAGHALFDVKAKDVDRLMIKPAEGAQITLVKDAAGWRFTEPVSAEADAQAVQDFVQTLAELKANSEEDLTDANRASYGLDKPKYQVEMSTTTGKLLKFNVGIKGALGDVTYVEVAGKQEVESEPSEVYDKLNQSIDTIRDKRLVTVPAQEIKQITITTPAQKIVAQKNGLDWQIIEPVRQPADQSAMTDLTAAIVGLQARSFFRSDSKQAHDARLDQPVLTVWFSTVPPPTQPATAPAATAATQPTGTTIVFGAYAQLDTVYASVNSSNEVVTVGEQSLNSFQKRPSDLRDRSVVNVDPAQVTKIEILREYPATQPAQPTETQVVLEKLPAATTRASGNNQPQWLLKSGLGGSASPEAVNALLSGVHPLRVLNYVDKAPSAQTISSHVLQLTLADGSQVRIALHDYAGGLPRLGEYNGLLFQVDAALESEMSASFQWTPDFLEGKFGKKPTPQNAPPPEQ